MRHLVPTAALLAITFLLLAKRLLVNKAYCSVSCVPIVFFLGANAIEQWYGFGWLTHVMFHLAYDTSYLLTLLGIVLVLISILHRDSVRPVLLAIFISTVPVMYLIFFYL